MDKLFNMDNKFFTVMGRRCGLPAWVAWSVNRPICGMWRGHSWRSWRSAVRRLCAWGVRQKWKWSAPMWWTARMES